jgi:hypothetical protein
VVPVGPKCADAEDQVHLGRGEGGPVHGGGVHHVVGPTRAPADTSPPGTP